MRLKKNPVKNLHKLLILYFFLWIILFEFILPVNNILPKPSVVLLSFSALWNDYKLPVNFLSTVGAIYISLALAYIIVWSIKIYLIKSNHFISDFLLSLHWFSNFIPWIILGIFLIYWLPSSEYIKYIFVFLISFFFIIVHLKQELRNVKKEYIESAISLGADEKTISKKIIWKSIQPQLFNHLITLHFQLWSLAIIFEFISGGYGLGNIYRRALEYKDISAIFTITIITGITIFLGSQLIKYLKNKFYHWSFV
ncbi:MAG: ABC transporter permease subunit [Bacteroidetes bacterium]|nr:ABC transporter permease subunit [Bacteroidota bacterium]